MHLIDTHMHLIARRRFGYAWADNIPFLASGDFLFNDRPAVASNVIAASLFMESAVDDEFYREEARWACNFAHKEPRLVGQIVSCRPEADEGFAAWLEESADLGAVGYRRVLHVVPDELSLRDGFRANIRRIGAMGKTFDICVLARQLPIAIALAKACPSVMFILDHCGVPDIAAAALDPWRADLAAMAALPNVACKLSGLTAYARSDLELEPQLRPFVDHVLHVFGPERIMWGSDWPVVELGSGLPRWLDLTKKLLASLSPDEASSIAFETAQRVYGIAPLWPALSN